MSVISEQTVNAQKYGMSVISEQTVNAQKYGIHVWKKGQRKRHNVTHMWLAKDD